jgi:hypothetical protein
MGVLTNEYMFYLGKVVSCIWKSIAYIGYLFQKELQTPFAFLSLENGNRQKVMKTCTEIKLRSSLDIYGVTSATFLCPHKQLCEFMVDICPCVYVMNALV